MRFRRTINVSGNSISGVGPWFERCIIPVGQLIIDLSNNSIGNSFLEDSLRTAAFCGSSLILNLSLNNISSFSFANLALYTTRFCEPGFCYSGNIIELSVDVSRNPLERLVTSRLARRNTGHPHTLPDSYAGVLSVDLSHSTSTLVLNLQTPFSGFMDIRWVPGARFNVSFAGNPSVHPSIVRTLSTAPNSPPIINVDLSWNNYTALSSGVLNGSRASWLDFSHNAITEIAGDAVDYNFDLTSLLFSHNNLTVLHA